MGCELVQTSKDGAGGDTTVTASSSGQNAGASTGLTSVATSGLSYYQEMQIAHMACPLAS